MKRFFVVLVVVLGCDAAHRDHGTMPDGGGIDAVTCGSTTCDKFFPATCVDGDTLREYAATCDDGTCSYPSTDRECGAAGCCSDHCCQLSVSNADVTGTLMPTGLTVAPPNGLFNTDTECEATSPLGKCSVVSRTDMPDACVCRMDKLTIGTLEVKGSRALVILAYDSVTIETVLDITGDRDVPGPGARGVVYTTRKNNDGGAGGSFATKGGNGGYGASALDGYGEPTLIPLWGGMTGEAGGNGDTGGGGGGAVQITAGARIDIEGKVLAGGGGGGGGRWTWGVAGGSGGGSGGAILLEAPAIRMTGRLDANGGGGGGAGGDDYYGNWGEDAADEFPSGGTSPDSGSGCALFGYIYGGHGGGGATSESAAGSGSSGGIHGGCIPEAFVGGGGGGGGAGRIRINTIAGCECSGNVSPTASFGTLGVQ